MSSGGSIFLSIASLAYIIMLVIVYFTKERVNTSENSIFTKLLVVSFLSLCSELYIVLMPLSMEVLPFVISLKLYLLLCVLWISYFMEYVFIITRNNERKELINYKNDYKAVYIIFWIIILLVELSIVLLPIYFHNGDTIKYSYGPSVNVLFGLSGVFTIIMLFYILKNFKHIKEKGYRPIIFLVLLLLATAIVQKINPGLLIANTCFALITTLMYYTIENPDIKMMKDLAYAKEVADISRSRTLDTLDEIDVKLKDTINKMFSFGYKKIDKNNIDELNSEISNFKKQSVKFADEISSLIELSKVSNGELYLSEEKYSIIELCEDMEKLLTMDKGNKKIAIKTNITSNVLPILYGDDKQIKQTMIYLFKYFTSIIKGGNINIDIDSINVGRFSKLKFKIILNNKELKLYNDFNDMNLYQLLSKRDDNINYKTFLKNLSLLDGSCQFTRNNDNDYEILITVMQRKMSPYEMLESTEENSNIKVRYFDLSDKRVLIVDDNIGKIKETVTLLSPYKIHYDVANNYEDAYTYLKSDKTYDFILLDDIISEYSEEISVTESIKYLKAIDKYKKTIIMMVNKDKEKNYDEYLSAGVDDYIVKPLNKGNINELLKKLFKTKN